MPIFQVEHTAHDRGRAEDDCDDHRTVEVVAVTDWWLPMERVRIERSPGRGGAHFIRGRVRAASEQEAETLLLPVLTEAAQRQGLPEWPSETTVCVLLDDE